MNDIYSNEEILRLYRETKNKSYLQDLIEKNKGFIYHCKKCIFGNSNKDIKLEEEDVLQEGYIGILRAVSKFDETRGVKFITFASKFIMGAMLDYIYKEIKYKVNTRDLECNINNIELDYYDVLLKYDVNNMIDGTLDQLEQKVIRLHYGFNEDTEYSIDQINKLLNICNAKYIIKKSLRKLRETAAAKEFKEEFYKEKLKIIEAQDKNPEMKVIRKMFCEEILRNL